MVVPVLIHIGGRVAYLGVVQLFEFFVWRISWVIFLIYVRSVIFIVFSPFFDAFQQFYHFYFVPFVPVSEGVHQFVVGQISLFFAGKSNHEETIRFKLKMNCYLLFIEGFLYDGYI